MINKLSIFNVRNAAFIRYIVNLAQDIHNVHIYTLLFIFMFDTT